MLPVMLVSLSISTCYHIFLSVCFVVRLMKVYDYHIFSLVCFFYYYVGHLHHYLSHFLFSLVFISFTSFLLGGVWLI